MSHPHVHHRDEFLAKPRHATRFGKVNDQFLEWVTNNVLASVAMFDIALVLPLAVLPMNDKVKLVLIIISSNWIQWWALPALQRSQNKIQARQDAKADADHKTIGYLAKIQDEQIEILHVLDPRSEYR